MINWKQSYDVFEILTERLGDPTLYDRPTELRETNTERSNIEPIVIKFREYKKLVADIAGNKDIIHTEKDEEMRDMAKRGWPNLKHGLLKWSRNLNSSSFQKTLTMTETSF